MAKTKSEAVEAPEGVGGIEQVEGTEAPAPAAGGVIAEEYELVAGLVQVNYV